MSEQESIPEQVEDGPQEWIAKTQGLVRSLAFGIRRGLPENVPVEDLIGYGQIGLLQAVKAYRPEYQTSFQTFAYYRIRGAMFDGVAKMAWASRADQKRFLAERAAHDVLASEHEENGDGNQTSSDQSQAAGWLVRTTEKLAVMQMLTGEEGSRESALEDRGERPDEQVARDEMWDLLGQIVKKLPEIERSLIELTYYEGKSLAESARILGHSKSWASRLHAQILQRLARSVNLLDVR